jgi:hypothetical protein
MGTRLECVEAEVLGLVHRAMIRITSQPSTGTPTFLSLGNGMHYVIAHSSEAAVEAWYNHLGRALFLLSEKPTGRSWMFPSLRIALANLGDVKKS